VIESDKLIRLGKASEPSLSTREAEHQTLSERVAEYLARGGQIEQVETGASGEAFLPKRTQAQQINFLRRRGWVERNNK